MQNAIKHKWYGDFILQEIGRNANRSGQLLYKLKRYTPVVVETLKNAVQDPLTASRCFLLLANLRSREGLPLVERYYGMGDKLDCAIQEYCFSIEAFEYLFKLNLSPAWIETKLKAIIAMEEVLIQKKYYFMKAYYGHLQVRYENGCESKESMLAILDELLSCDNKYVFFVAERLARLLGDEAVSILEKHVEAASVPRISLSFRELIDEIKEN